MVVVAQAVHHYARPAPAHDPHDPRQAALQTRSVRRRPLPRAAFPALSQCPRGRHHLRSGPERGPALRLGGILHAVRRHGGVHDR